MTLLIGKWHGCRRSMLFAALARLFVHPPLSRLSNLHGQLGSPTSQPAAAAGSRSRFNDGQELIY